MQIVKSALSAIALVALSGCGAGTNCQLVGLSPYATKLVNPKYPEAALAAGVMGSTAVNVFVNGSGVVTSTSIKLSSGNASLDAAAVAGAKASSYSGGGACGGSGGGTTEYDANFNGQTAVATNSFTF